MIQKKVCTLGAYAVGKTSLVERFTRSIFTARYHTTVGVRIHKRVVRVGNQDVGMIIWDLAGEDELVEVRVSYLRGSAGYLLVADGTRRATLEKAIELQKRAEAAVGSIPFLLAVNKNDLRQDWSVSEDSLRGLERQGWDVVATSAKTGVGVEQLFLQLAGTLLGRHS